MKVYFFKLNGCGHCDIMKSTLDNLRKSIPTVSIQEIEHNDKNKLSTELQKTLHTDNINAYPELKMITLNNKETTYSGPRTVESITAWIKINAKPSGKSNTKTGLGLRTKRSSSRLRRRRHSSIKRTRNRNKSRHRR
jgi:glutaredoxin